MRGAGGGKIEDPEEGPWRDAAIGGRRRRLAPASEAAAHGLAGGGISRGRRRRLREEGRVAGGRKDLSETLFLCNQ
jgi:hypothetical protein